MKKKTIIISILLVVLVVLVIRYGFVLVFWLTTPKDGELRPAEKVLFEKIKKEDNAKDVWREPKYNMTSPKDTITYRLIVNGIPCLEDTLALKNKAQDIRTEIDKLKLHKNFYKYQVLYECVDGKEYTYSFKR
ncbi:flagellar basal body-associated protein FliL [Chryseobacterium sp. H1D6B]|uniref:hypothetical protein n=1 Tax=Chryseobacterium sp. H1D6B TaxID=2940588 RepID=UPI0015CDEC66|nr:hypothetical protein [Chryseobacterium sp. H1D6B]MDH6252782.1 flagellar basal body-associated protein FliL [Chryseobacterium sp. H1D6B]